MSAIITRRRFTVEVYHRMIESGVFLEDDRVELLDGEIIEMSPIGKEHAAAVKNVNRWAIESLGRKVMVGVQDPIVIGERSEPQPDVTILKYRKDSYKERLPEPEDVLLVVEVADTSEEYDREIKLPHYAGAGIREALLVVIPSEVLELHSSPSRGRYRRVKRFRRGQSVRPSAFPDVEMSVEEILGPRS